MLFFLEKEVVNVIDIKSTVSQTDFLHNRTPFTTEADEERAFAHLGSVADGEIYVGGFSGQSAWEKHPSGNEMVQVIGGETIFEIIEDGEKRTHTLSSGQMIVVPQGLWHRFISEKGVYLMTITPIDPMPTEISSKEHPVLGEWN